MAKFTCILIAFLAILNAPHYTVADIAADKAYDEKNWGSSFFPHVAGIQSDVFKGSLTGSLISQRADVLLIAKNEDKPKKKKDNLH